MRLRLKVRLKAIFVSCLLGILVYLGINVMFVSDESSDSSSNERGIARIGAEDMEMLGKLRQIKNQVKEVQDPHIPVFPLHHSIIHKSAKGRYKKLVHKSASAVKTCDETNCVPISENTNSKDYNNHPKSNSDFLKEFRGKELLHEDLVALNKEIMERISSAGSDFMDIAKLDCIGKKCKLRDDSTGTSKKGGYAGRVMIETITLPSDWSPSEELSRKIHGRKEHAKEVCHKYGLDKRTSSYRPNSWEFLINEKYGLVWCSIFKAASSTWFYNFNILAGYTESHLLSTKETPIALARKRYPRPSVNELDRVINSTNKTLSFMIARHPFERLVSAFRDKIQSGNRFYRNLARKIMAAYPSMGPKSQKTLIEEAVKVPEKSIPKSKTFLKYVPPSFQQFVQFIIESFENSVPLDEHWTPMTNFCTPCLVDFDVYAKVESLDEDGNYIIFKSGIDKLIHPKRINRSKNEPTHEVARSYLCQLSADQKDRLLKVYKYDLEIFDYQSDHLLNCTNYS